MKKEVRVLGCLLEKEMATPEYYPLSLNALVNACNQKSNRDPVQAYDEDTVIAALDGLKQKQLVLQSNFGRVAKYEEMFLKTCNFVNRETSILCELMLRGAQTPGELRIRAERMHAFKSLEEVCEVLSDLESMSYVVKLERQPGRKEARYAHLLSGHPPDAAENRAVPNEQAHAGASVDTEKIALLEERLNSLEREVEGLKQAFLDFKRQLE
ncbi:MAG: YceH family protein [Pseudomonadota bacterium]